MRMAMPAEVLKPARVLRICKIWDSEYPWDVRAEKIARALTDAGHEVHMVARNRDGRPLTETLPECTVHRLKPLSFLGSTLNAASMFPAFFNPRWKNKILETARAINADTLIVRDLPLAPTAIWAGRRMGIPVVLDMAENYPAMINAIYWESGRYRVSDWVVRNPALARHIERWTLARVDHTLVVVKESKERLVGLGVDPSRVSIVSNTPPMERIVAGEVSARQLAPHEPLDVVYLGILEIPRGLATLIRALHCCRQSAINVRATVIGEGRDRAEFERQAHDLGLKQEHIRFLGYIENTEALQLVRTADVGVIPHHADESWNTTIPNKLFDYMSVGLPVVASSAAPVKRLIGETGCGLVFNDRDDQDLARTFGRMRDAATRAACGKAGRSAIANHYHWRRDSLQLLSALEHVVARQMPGRFAVSANRPRA
jgi:glycosyltransferase involved in cell wall biosynthesis